MAGGATRPVEILVRDSQSSPNRAAQVAASLIKSDKVDLMLVASTADTVNPVADQCEINQVPCVSTDAPWQTYLLRPRRNPRQRFRLDVSLLLGRGGRIADHVRHLRAWCRPIRSWACLWANDTEGNFYRRSRDGVPAGFRSAGL